MLPHSTNTLIKKRGMATKVGNNLLINILMIAVLLLIRLLFPCAGMRKHALDRPFSKSSGIDFSKFRGAKRSRRRRIGDVGVEVDDAGDDEV